MSGHDPLALAEWQRVRRYAVPPRMIAECADARERGDRRAAWAAGRIDVSEAAADLVTHLAPDLLRWHLPRALGGHTTLAVDQPHVLVPADAVIGPDTVVPVVQALLSMYGSQRLRLDAARWDELDLREVSLVPAHLWDARHADDLRAAIGGSTTRAPAFTGAGDPLPAEALGSSDDPASRGERARLTPTPAGAFAEAGFVIGEDPATPWPGYEDEQLLRVVDPVRLAHHLRLVTRQTGVTTWSLWAGHSDHLRCDVDGDTVRATWQSVGDYRTTTAWSLPRLHPDLVRHQVDLDLIRAGRITPAEVHPMVRAALFPSAPPLPSAGRGAVAAPAPAVVAGAVRVRCRGDWHEIGVRLGRLDLPGHTDTERRRERALGAFGGAVSGCFAAEQAWQGEPGRLPRRLRAHREDLWQLMIHGGTRTVFELLDAGMNPHLRDSRGRTLMHRARSFDYGRLLPRLLAEGLDVNARDKEGSTPLYLAVVHRWPADLIIALADAGADPRLPNQYDMSVIEHCDEILEILDYLEDVDPDFETAVAYLRERSP
ncbi:ankyrin repeat domain-containing protein [Actinoplanes sp. CA-252034]|uniref:ankyrin repeat domain-containing protein n=1 Tax=Actinoplanes sp. CA-252034 TaxID=3239906 RepID=UPI003D97C2FE